MGQVTYNSVVEHAEYNQYFRLEIDRQGVLRGIRHKDDPYHMNWLREDFLWGKVICPEELLVKVSRGFTRQGNLQETYCFSNETAHEVFILNHEIGIYTPLPDNYKSSEICMKERAHAHVWCGKNTSYIYALRMGGAAPHLGMILTKGSLDGYSIERNLETISNDRGSIILHPEGFWLKPGESYCLQWEFVWFDHVNEFFDKMSHYEQAIQVRLNRYLFFEGETMQMWIRYCDPHITEKDIKICRNGKETAFHFVNQADDSIAFRAASASGEHALRDTRMGMVYLEEKKDSLGKESWDIEINGCHTFTEIYIHPPFEQLLENRCKFIAQFQQYQDAASPLFGSFLIYDTEEKRQYYSHVFDHNGGRERVCMGVLLAAYLQKKRDVFLEKSLQLFTDYVYRELYDEETGTVFNDVCRNNEWHRLYNYPWMALFFLERYRLYRNERDLKNMWKILMAYYRNGGSHFYAIAIPVTESLELLNEAGWKEEAEKLERRYCEHGEYLIANGLMYPAHEVNYEQSIVAPAVTFLFQMYQVTQESKFLDAAKRQLAVLELFSGKQPSFHLYETAIRHWDGYWFGKRRCFGDTFPHYWSALSGIAYKTYYEITKDQDYLRKAEHSFRGTLSLIHSDGSASCAFVYPHAVNGVQAHYADPWANDQDWGLYFYLKFIEAGGKK